MDDVDLGAETVILGLLVLVAVVLSVSAVVSEFVFVWAGHVGVLEVAVVLLLVGRWRVFAIRNNSGHNGAQNKNLKIIFTSFWFSECKITKSEEQFSSNLNLKEKIEKELFNSPQEKSSCWRMQRKNANTILNCTGRLIYTCTSLPSSPQHYSVMYFFFCCFPFVVVLVFFGFEAKAVT